MSRISNSLDEVRQLQPVHQMRIPVEFLDENGHVNVQYYLYIVERGLGRVFEQVGLGAAYAAADVHGNFALEQHIRYLAEILAGDLVSVHIRLLELTAKRGYFIGFLVNDTREELAATVEVVMMNVNMRRRRGAPFPDAAFKELEALLQRHQALSWTAPVCGVMRA